MKIREYIKEIKVRGRYIIITGIITMGSAYVYAWEMIEILAKPLEEAYEAKMKGMVENSYGEEIQQKGKIATEVGNVTTGEGMGTSKALHFIFTEITEAFEAATEVSIYVTMYALLPIILFHIWSFIKPGLYEYEKKKIMSKVKWYMGITWINIIITYKVIIPETCKFMLSFERSGVEALKNGMEIQLEAKIYTYLCWVEKTVIYSQMIMIITVGVVWTIWSGMATRERMKKMASITRKRRVRLKWYVGAMIAPAIVAAPTEIWSQMIMAIGLMLLYEMTVYTVCMRTALGSVMGDDWVKIPPEVESKKEERKCM